MIANCIKHYTFRVHMAENKIKYYNDEDMVSLFGKDMVVSKDCVKVVLYLKPESVLYPMKTEVCTLPAFIRHRSKVKEAMRETVK